MTVRDAVEESEIVGLGGDLYGYRKARGAGYSHGECVEITGMGAHLGSYRKARDAGYTHATIVDAVTVHGLFNRFLERITASPDVDPATVVFETVTSRDRHGRHVT